MELSIFNYNLTTKYRNFRNTKLLNVKIRNLITQLEHLGLDKKKFQLTIENLKSSDISLKYYVEKNKKENSLINHQKKELILILTLE